MNPDLAIARAAVLRPIQQIADRLGISRNTVRNHVSNIFSKLQVATRAQAILRAREAGFDHQ